MKFLRLLMVTTALSPALARAQSNPGLVDGQLPHSGDWNGYFGAKGDAVANNAALKALSNATATRVQRLGFATPGDGGAADYVYSSSACTLNSGAGDDGSQVQRTSGGCWNIDARDGIPDLRVWGAKADGVTDITPALNAALAVGSARLACGSYAINTAPAAITANYHSVIGADKSCVTLTVTYATGDVFGPNTVTYNRFSGFTITSSVTRTSGAYFHLTGTYDVTLNDIAYAGPAYDLVLLDGANTTHIESGDMHATASRACVEFVNNTVDTYIHHINPVGCGNAGLHITYASGVYLDDMDILGATSGVLIDPSSASGQNVNAVFAGSNFLTDTSGVNGWTVVGTGAVTEIYLTNAWASGSVTGAGIYLNNPLIDGFSVTNLHAHHNCTHGIDIESAKRVTIGAGSRTVMNSVCGGSPGSYDGIHVAAGVSNVTIDAAQSGDGGYMEQDLGLTNRQGYGVSVAAGSGSNIVVTSDNLCGNVTAGASILATGTGVNVANNPCFATAASGSSAIASSTTSITVSHGMSVTPTQVQITPTSAPGSIQLYVSATTSTTFTVTATSAPGGSLSFNWRAGAFGS